MTFQDFIQILPSATAIGTFVAVAVKLIKSFSNGLGSLKKEVRETMKNQGQKVEELASLQKQAEEQNKTLIKENSELKVKLSHLSSQLDDILTLRDEIKLLNNSVQTQITLTDSTLRSKIDDYNRTILQLKRDYTSKGEKYEIGSNS